MKIKTRMIDITPEELVKLPPDLIRELLMTGAETLHDLDEADSEEVEPMVTGKGVEGEANVAEEGELTPETRYRLTQRVMSRRSIPKGQQHLYRALYGAAGNELSKSALADAMGRTEHQIVGVLGALGNRIGHTANQMGLDSMGIGLFLDVTHKNGEWHYRLRDEFRAFLAEKGYEWLHGK